MGLYLGGGRNLGFLPNVCWWTRAVVIFLWYLATFESFCVGRFAAFLVFSCYR